MQLYHHEVRLDDSEENRAILRDLREIPPEQRSQATEWLIEMLEVYWR